MPVPGATGHAVEDAASMSAWTNTTDPVWRMSVTFNTHGGVVCRNARAAAASPRVSYGAARDVRACAPGPISAAAASRLPASSAARYAVATAISGDGDAGCDTDPDADVAAAEALGRAEVGG